MPRTTQIEGTVVIRDVDLGANVRHYGFINLYECSVGDDLRIGAFVEIQKKAYIGKRCKISSHTFICEGVRIGDDVFVGHGVMFINDRYPSASIDGRPIGDAWNSRARSWKWRLDRIERDRHVRRSHRQESDGRRRSRCDPGRARQCCRRRKPGPSDAETHRRTRVTPANLRVPFNDLAWQWRAIESEIAPDLKRLFETSAYALGWPVDRFEQHYARFIGARHAIGVSSGTAALHLAVVAAGVGPGDRVPLPAHTFIATAWAVLYVGAQPIFCDVEPESGTIDVADAERRMQEGVKAIIPVDLYGQPADMRAVMDFAAKYRLTVIEDAAQSHGAL